VSFHLLLILAVWGVWTLLETLIEDDIGDWVWILLALILGLGAQLLLDWDQWYLGLGIGGGAVLLMRLTDLLLVTTDWVRVHVLRTRPSR
jgi:hypothetical protein